MDGQMIAVKTVKYNFPEGNSRLQINFGNHEVFLSPCGHFCEIPGFSSCCVCLYENPQTSPGVHTCLLHQAEYRRRGWTIR